METLPERMARVEERMDRVEEGISNYRKFQVDAREFFTEHRANEKSREMFEEQRTKAINDGIARHTRKGERKINLILATCAVFSVLLGYLTFVVTFHGK